MNKFGAKKLMDGNGVWWDSQGEYRRYCDLQLLEKAGVITHLEVHPTLSLILNGQKLCKYTLDFKYLERGKWVYEDFKGYQTREFKLKRKLVKALLGIDVRVTTSNHLSRTPRRGRATKRR